MCVIEMPTDNVFTMRTVPIKFGLGVSSEVGFDLKSMGLKSALLITDKNIMETGMPDKLRKVIEDEGIKVEIYDEVHCEPTDKSFAKAISDLKGKEYDGFVALGGGSVIDTAKAINLFTTYPADILDYVNKPIGKAKPVPGPLKPLFALPTTAGTGSECTPVIVLDILDLKVKTGISNQYIRPTMGIIDPINTLTMPPEVTASTGTDVLTHALESYLARPYDSRPKPENPGARPAYVGSNPISDMWSAKAIEYVGKYLRRAYSNPYDIEARTYMMLAATFAGVGFGNAGVHIPHSMAYPIAGMVRDYVPKGWKTDEPMVPHGISVTVNAPAAFRFTARANLEKHAEAAYLLGVDISGKSVREAAYSLSDAIIDLMKDIRFPNGVAALGFTESDIPALVEGTLKQQRLLSCSPIPVGAEDLTEIFKEAMSYW